MTVGNALESLAEERGSVGVLSDTSIKFVGPAYNAQQAATLFDYLSGGQQTTVQLQNHADDFVGTLVGQNPATYDKRPADSNKLYEWYKIFGDAPTVHSCYGTGEISQQCGKFYGDARTINISSSRNSLQGGSP